jgi:uncharacterized protein DUF4440
MDIKRRLGRGMALVMMAFGLCCATAFAETIYVDGDGGDDANPGTRDKPVRTIARAVEMVNGSSEPGPTTVKLAPGMHVIDETVTFENQRAYKPDARLTIEATVLPDDPQWKPAQMPVVLSTVQGMLSANEMHALSIRIEVSHVTVRGLNFLGNPRARTWHYAIYRAGKNLQDLLVTQCLFLGGGQALEYSCPICANGHGLVVDHCIFYDCDIPVIFWNAEGGVSKGNAMRHCIVDGADVAAVWTCQTAEDFEFHHNVITRSQYVWMRSPGNKKVYRVRDCVMTESKYASGTGTASAINGPTGADVTFAEENVVKRGAVRLVVPGLSPQGLSAERPRNYLHVMPGTLGSNLRAGLLTKPATPSPPTPNDSGSRERDESRIKDEVWETVRSVNRSWLGYDMEALSSHCHPDVVIVAPGFGRRSEGRQASLSSYEGFISMATVEHFTETDPTIDLCDDTAVVTYRIEIAADVDGRPYAEQGRELHVLKRTDNRWLSIWRMVVPDKEQDGGL